MFDVTAILPHFRFDGEFLSLAPYGSGHINDTFEARFRGDGDTVHRYILQRINHHVFRNPTEVMHNMERVTAHIQRKIAAAGGDPTRKTITLIPTVTGESCYRSPHGGYWRAHHFIAGARTYPAAKSPGHNYQAAKVFGEFLVLLDDFPLDQLFETIPNFHHTPKRLQAFTQAVQDDHVNRVKSAQPEIDFVTQRAAEAQVLVALVEKGEMPERVTHNDTKIDNVMIDDQTGEGLCAIDLDTVMPGLSVFDFGDAVRSGANTAAEDEPITQKVRFDLEVFDHLAGGFLEAAGDILTPIELDHLAFGAKLITLEQGIRFLTDYLNGDAYYKTQRENQNLDRCRTQLKLAADMEENYDLMLKTVEKYRNSFLRNAVEAPVPRKLRNQNPLQNSVPGVSGELSPHKSSESRKV